MHNSWGGDPDSIPWTALERPGSWMRELGDGVEDGPWIVQIRFEPNAVVPVHWHKCDTVYLIHEGSMSFGPDAAGNDKMYRAGDIRWVRAGYYYGPETAGPDGCTFTLIGSAGDLWPSYDVETSNGLADR
jgi:hypothetical protein